MTSYDGEGRSRRSIASVGGEVNHYEDPDKLTQQPPNITPVGGVPNLKVSGVKAEVILGLSQDLNRLHKNGL